MSAFMRLFSRRKKKAGSNILDGASSGSKRQQKSDIECKVIFLDGTESTFYMPKKALASRLYELVFTQLDFSSEQDYFAIQYTDTHSINHWLDPNKKIRHQCQIGPPYTLKFRVKFYSSDPHHLHDELTRYLFVLQLRQDIRIGRLQCDDEIGADLAALCLQGEFGDYDAKEHTPAFVSGFRFLPDDRQTEEFELLVLQKYKEFRGRNMTPAATDKIYLEKTRVLADYGVDMHNVKGKDNADYKLGLTPTGILIYEGQQKIGLFFWPRIDKLEFRKNKLKVVVSDENETTKEVTIHTFVFSLPETRACKHLWKCAVEHHSFFRLIDPKKPVKTQQIFRMRSNFSTSFRTEYQMMQSNTFGTSQRRASSFQRTPSRRFSARPSFEKAELEHRKAERDRLREERNQKRRVESAIEPDTPPRDLPSPVTPTVPVPVLVTTPTETGGPVVVVEGPPCEVDRLSPTPRNGTSAPLPNGYPRKGGVKSTSSSRSSDEEERQESSDESTDREDRILVATPAKGQQEPIASGPSPLITKTIEVKVEGTRPTQVPAVINKSNLTPDSVAVSPEVPPESATSVDENALVDRASLTVPPPASPIEAQSPATEEKKTEQEEEVNEDDVFDLPPPPRSPPPPPIPTRAPLVRESSTPPNSAPPSGPHPKQAPQSTTKTVPPSSTSGSTSSKQPSAVNPHAPRRTNPNRAHPATSTSSTVRQSAGRISTDI